MNTTLHFLNFDIDLFYVDTRYQKAYDSYRGIPVSYNQDGLDLC